jgi:hypothetical protein
MDGGVMIINSVVGGAGESSLLENGDFRVRFIDYDGTVLKTRWINSGDSVTPPANPSHTGLEFQEWNRTDYTNITEDRDIGAVYRTSDGATKATVRINAVTGLVAQLYIFKTDGSTLTVDWGDGTTSTNTATGNTSVTRTYAAAGDYIVSMSITKGVSITSGAGTYSLGQGTDTIAFCGSATQVRRDQLMRLHVGDNVTVTRRALYLNRSLEYVTFPTTVLFSDHESIRNCNRLRAVVFPSTVTEIPSYVLNLSSSCKFAIMGSGVTSIGEYAFGQTAVDRAYVPNATLGTYIYNACFSIKRITYNAPSMPAGTLNNTGYADVDLLIPEGATTMGNAFAAYAATLKSLSLPSTTTTVTALTGNTGLQEVICLAETPPTLAASAFPAVYANFKIWVLPESVDLFKGATNWITYADYIFSIAERP